MTNMNFENETRLLTRKSLFQEHLNNSIGENEAKAYINGNGYTVQFLSSNRIYTINETGNIIQEDINILKADNTPGSFDGSGTQDNPYMIMSIEDLVYFSQTVGNGTTYKNNYIKMGRTLDFNSELSYVNYETKDYNEFLEVTDDIGLLEALTSKETRGFKPISGTFEGFFDGNNNILKNLYINREGNAGLFGAIKTYGAKIENLEITGEIICEGNNAGSIIAKLGGGSYISVNNCLLRVNITSTGDFVAGIVGGETGGGVTNCINYGNIEGKIIVSGINARYGGATNCKNYGNINGVDHVGGINGQYGSNKNCQNYGQVKAEETCAGGITAQTGAGLIINCSNYGKVIANSTAGGIIGNGGRAINCYNEGEIKAISSGAGGISGYIAIEKPIINCYNAGKVESITKVGGIVGDVQFTQNDTSKIINSYNVGELTGNSYVGGIIGRKDGYGVHYIENCYWPNEFNLTVGNATYGTLTVTNSESYDLSYMKSNDFLNLLNNYVNEYNNGNREYTDSIELFNWNIDIKTGYPTLPLDIIKDID